MKRFWYLVAVAVVAGLIVALVSGVFSSGGGSSSTSSVSVEGSGNSTTNNENNGPGAVIGEQSGAITNNFNGPESKKSVSPYGTQTEVSFTIENSVREGVWSLTSPDMQAFMSADEEPQNADRWFANGTQVLARCARPGTPYETTVNGHATHWEYFAELNDGTYVPMAGFSQTTEDGAQHLIRCKHS